LIQAECDFNWCRGVRVLKSCVRPVLFGVLALTLAACGDPNKIKFVALCSEAGDSETKCSCTFDRLQADIGEIDEEFVNFVADFAKWGLEDGETGLDNQGLIEKYDLSPEEFQDLTLTVGSTMLQALSGCS